MFSFPGVLFMRQPAEPAGLCSCRFRAIFSQFHPYERAGHGEALRPRRGKGPPHPGGPLDHVPLCRREKDAVVTEDYSPEASLDILRALDRIRASWGLRFTFEQ